MLPCFMVIKAYQSIRLSVCLPVIIIINSIKFSGGSRIFARGVRQLVPLECPKPLYALSPSDP